MSSTRFCCRVESPNPWQRGRPGCLSRSASPSAVHSSSELPNQNHTRFVKLLVSFRFRNSPSGAAAKSGGRRNRGTSAHGTVISGGGVHGKLILGFYDIW